MPPPFGWFFCLVSTSCQLPESPKLFEMTARLRVCGVRWNHLLRLRATVYFPPGVGIDLDLKGGTVHGVCGREGEKGLGL